MKHLCQLSATSQAEPGVGASARPRPYGGRSGFTIIELLVVLAVIAVILTIGLINGRTMLEGRKEIAAVNSLRQSAWQGATAASARGRKVRLVFDGRRLEIVDGTDVIRTDVLPDGVQTNLPQGTLLEFLPPGKATLASITSLNALDPMVSTNAGTVFLEFSLIGEVRVGESQ